MSTETRTLEEMQARVFERGKQPAQPAGDSAAARLVAEDQRRRERERLARRAEVRQQIKQRAVLIQQVEDLESQLRLLDEKADGLAAEHQSKTAPIQESLTSASGSKRSALLEKLTAANIELEQGLAVVERMRGLLTKQHRETRSSAAALPTENRLAGGDLASPALLAEKHAAECRRQAAQMRVDRAAEMLGRFAPELERMRATRVPESSHGWSKVDSRRALDYETIHTLQLRVDRWRCELTHASQELHASQEALAEITREMCNE